jgi:hypothetical protein
VRLRPDRHGAGRAPDGPLDLYALTREQFVAVVTGYRASATAGEAMVSTRLQELGETAP